jgi:D-threo-aldose 1-dehydrogenase
VSTYTKNRDPGVRDLGPLGFGAGPLGNLYSAVSDADAEEALEAAERSGIKWFDVAPLYGLGLAEERLGRFFQRFKNAERIVSTKVGRILESTQAIQNHEQFAGPLRYRAVFDYSRAGIERSYEHSLHRLGLDRVQILLLHDVDRLTHATGHRALVKQLLDEALPTLHRLKAEGRVDAIGLGINEWDIGYEILASAEIDCVLLAGRYTLIDQSAEQSGFLDACTRRGVSVLAGGVFNSGLLVGGSTFNYTPASKELVSRRDALAALCNRYQVPLGAAAIQFTAAHPAVTSVVVGARSAQEITEISEWRKMSIPQALWDELPKRG